MGGMLTQPVTEKRSDHGEGLGLRYGLSSMQGWRPEMEDAHAVKVGLDYGLDDWSFFAVFDGHAGKASAGLASWNLLDFILNDSLKELKPLGACFDQNFFEPVITETPSDDEMRHSVDQSPKSEPLEPLSPETPVTKQETASSKKPEQEDELIESSTPKFVSSSIKKQSEMVINAIKSGFLRFDQTMRLKARDMSGCTAICALLSPTHLFIANCGDSRAVLWDGECPRFATVDHKPYDPIERKRIVNAGGTATQRINGTLAVSRALGDYEFKKDNCRGPCEQLVSPEPEVTVIERKPQDEFLILACDGIWDVIENLELCQFVKHQLLVEPNIENICSSVLDVCLCKGSRDNMSIIIIVFENGPKFSDQELERAKKNDETLLNIADSHQKDINIEFSSFLNILKDNFDQIQHVVPPGAGLEAKYDLLRERFEQNIQRFEQKLLNE